MAESVDRMGTTTTGSVRMPGGEPSPGLPSAVRVRAPARLHFGFLDMHGGLGRRFGSVGLAIDTPALQIRASAAPRASAKGAEAERIRTYMIAAAAHLDVPDAVSIEVEEAIPAHAGFGSGTQLALAVAAALARLNGKTVDLLDFADVLERGNRSGVGLAAFTEGGLIVDGGRDASGAPPPVISRLPWPEAWRVVLILDDGVTGVHGSSETEAFRELPPFEEARAAEICRITLMQVLPAVATADLDTFGKGVTAIQDRIGDYFAPHQGGRYASPAVAEVLRNVAAQGISGYGQSSWGPTGFALVPTDRDAQALVSSLERPGRLRFVVARGRNDGASVSDI